MEYVSQSEAQNSIGRAGRDQFLEGGERSKIPGIATQLPVELCGSDQSKCRQCTLQVSTPCTRCQGNLSQCWQRMLLAGASWRLGR